MHTRFENSVVKNSDGSLRRVYHGSFSDIHQFEGSKMGFGLLGKGFYFTDSASEVSENYANIEFYKSIMGPQFEVGKQNRGVVYPAHIALQNPLIAGGRKPTYFKIDDGSLDRFIQQFEKTSDRFPEIPQGGVSYMAKERFLKEAKMSKKGLTVEDITSLVSRQLGLNPASEGFCFSHVKMDFIRQVFEDMGFDGIIFEDVKKRFGAKMRGIEESTKHYVVFDPANIGFALCIAKEIKITNEAKKPRNRIP